MADFLKYLWKNIFYILVALSVVILYYLLDMPCIFLLLFKTPCPACGMTRAFLALLRFDINASLRYNPVTVPAIIIIALNFYKVIFNKHGKIIKIITIAGSIMIFAVYLIRLFSGRLAYL